jgi:hypothetical protein
MLRTASKTFCPSRRTPNFDSPPTQLRHRAAVRGGQSRCAPRCAGTDPSDAQRDRRSTFTAVPFSSVWIFCYPTTTHTHRRVTAAPRPSRLARATIATPESGRGHYSRRAAPAASFARPSHAARLNTKVQRQILGYNRIHSRGCTTLHLAYVIALQANTAHFDVDIVVSISHYALRQTTPKIPLATSLSKNKDGGSNSPLPNDSSRNFHSSNPRALFVQNSCCPLGLCTVGTFRNSPIIGRRVHVPTRGA